MVILSASRKKEREERESECANCGEHRKDQAMTEEMMQQKFFLSPLARWI
jgi:hypothetical protein